MVIRKKKDGSALLMVMVVSAILIVFAGGMSSAVIATAKSNADFKRNEDVYYAAESGLEHALGQVRGDKIDFTLTPDPDPYNIDFLFDNEKIKVTVDIDPVDGKDDVYSVTSTAKKDNDIRTRTLKSKISYNKYVVNKKSNLFEYSWISNKIKIYEGSFNKETGVVNGTDEAKVYKYNPSSTHDGSVCTSPPSGEICVEYKDKDDNPIGKCIHVKDGTDQYDVQDNGFIMPDFDNITPCANLAFNSPHEFITFLNNSKTSPVQGVKHIGYNAGGQILNVFIINTENIYINLSTGLQLNNTVIFTPGKVKIKASPDRYPIFGNVHFANSTIVSDEMEIWASSVTTQKPPYNEDNNTEGILTDDMVDPEKPNNIFGIIEKEVPGFDMSTGETEERWELGDMEME